MSLSRPHLLLLLLPACVERGPPGSGQPADPALDPTPYAPTLDDAADEGALLSPEELGLGLQEVIDYLHRLDPLLHYHSWTDSFWANADADCPEMQLHNGMDYWDDRCTSEAGAEFRGWTLNLRGESWEESPGVVMLGSAWLSGHAVLTLPDGDVLENFGDVLYQHRREGPGVEAWQGFVYGDFSSTQAEAEGSWLQSPVSNETYYRFEQLDSGGHVANFDAALAYLSGPVVAIRIENLRLSSEPGSCALEPVGQIRLRDGAGRWVELGFEPTEASDPACDGCGIATYDGEALGSVCADFSPLLDWPDGSGVYPWVR